MSAAIDCSLDRGLPASLDAERAVLGAILLDNSTYNQAAGYIKADDFSLDSHKRIFLRMTELTQTSKPIDFVTLYEQLSRHKEVEAVGGAAYITSLTDGLPRVKNIEQYTAIVKDKALLRSLIHAASVSIQCAYEQEEDAGIIVSNASRALQELEDRRTAGKMWTIEEIVKEKFGSIESIYRRDTKITGVETHFEDLDNLTCGLQKGDLILIAARPSMGKTSFAVNIAENAGLRGKAVVAIFSLEMSRESLLQRMLCSLGQVDSHKLAQGFLSREDMGRLTHALGELLESRIRIDDTPGATPTYIRAKSRQLKQECGALDLIVVDYIQLLSGDQKRYENRVQEVSYVSRSLKHIAKELNCPIVALAQLSRAPELRTGNHRPQLSDLRESGSLEQDSDIVGFIYREEMYKPNDMDLEGEAELIIAKNRNGALANIPLAFLKQYMRFENRVRDSYDHP